MTRLLLAGAAALGMMTGAATAQTSTSVTTTTTTPSASAPVTITSTATTEEAVGADGDRTSTSGTSSRDGGGNATGTTITNTTYPLTNMILTTRKTDNTVNGVTTETVTTTQTWPPVVGRPDVAPVTTTTQTIKPETK